MSVSVIITAGGSGLRLGGRLPKQFQFLGGKPILARTINAFNRSEAVSDIIVAAPADYVTHANEIVDVYDFHKVRAVVAGGENRAASIYAALKMLPRDKSVDTYMAFKTVPVVLVHDGVRPFVSEMLIRTVAEAARIHGAAIAGTPLTDTIKEVNEGSKVVSTPDRKRFWRVQTPQAFTYDLIMKAYAQGEKDGVLPHATDDSMLVERLGLQVTMVEGHPGNIKITTPEDMAFAEMLLRGNDNFRA